MSVLLHFPLDYGQLLSFHCGIANYSSHDNMCFVKLTLAERRRFHTAVQVFKSVHRLCPVYLNDFFVNSVALKGHCGRNPYQVFTPRVRTLFGKAANLYYGACSPLEST